MTEQADTCTIVMQPWNNWRGALEVKLSNGQTVVLNDNQYTSDSPVHEVFTVPGTVTDLWWAKDQNGNWFDDSHYSITNCKFDHPYHSVPGKQPSVTIELNVAPSSSSSTTSSVPETTVPPATTNTTEPPTYTVVSDPIPSTSTTILVPTSNPPTLPNTGTDVWLLGFLAVGAIATGLALQWRNR